MLSDFCCLCGFPKNNVVFRAGVDLTSMGSQTHTHTHQYTHSCCSSSRTPEQVISWTERAQLWITAFERKARFANRFGRLTEGPRLPPWPAPVGDWRPRTYQQWCLTGASLRDTSRSANANALSESDCINTQSRYLQHPLENHQGKKVLFRWICWQICFFFFLS